MTPIKSTGLILTLNDHNQTRTRVMKHTLKGQSASASQDPYHGVGNAKHTETRTQVS